MGVGPGFLFGKNMFLDDSNPMSMIASYAKNAFSPFFNGMPEAEGFEQNMIMGFTFAPPNIKWGIDYSKDACFGPVKVFGVTIIPRFCIVVFAVFLGYNFGIAVGLRLPLTVNVVAIPNRVRAEEEFTIQTTVTPQDFDAKDFFDFCQANPNLKAQTWLITSCEKFKFVNFFDQLDPFIEEDAKDGDEFVARYKAKAGLFVTIANIRVVNWGIDQDVDLAGYCSILLSKADIDTISLIQAFFSSPPDPSISGLSQWIKDQLTNCGSFTMPFASEQVGTDITTGEPILEPLSFPGVGKELTVRANCIDALILGEFLIVGSAIIPICTGVALQYGPASLGVGLGIKTFLGSKTITADWATAGDADRDGIIKYDGLNKVPPIDGDFDKNIVADNHDPNTDDANVNLNDYTYFLNDARIIGTAILDFGGVLEFISDIPAFELFNYNFFPQVTIPGFGGTGIPIPQHPFTDGIDDINIFVENNALTVSLTPPPVPIEPGFNPEDSQFTITNIGSVEDDFDNFVPQGFRPDGTPGPFIFTKSDETTTGVAKNGVSNPVTVNVDLDRVFTTRPGIYTMHVLADSVKAKNPPQLMPKDPLDNFRIGATSNVVNVEVLPFSAVEFDVIPLEPVVPLASLQSLDPLNDRPGIPHIYELLIQNQGSKTMPPDTLTITHEFIDFDTDGTCTFTTCPQRSMPTIIQGPADLTMQSGWISNPLMVNTHSIEAPNEVIPRPTFEITVPSEWIGMQDTIYDFEMTLTPDIPRNAVTVPATLHVTATKESMTRYIDKEIDDLIGDIHAANEEGVKTGPSLFIAMEAVERTHDKTLISVLADDFNNADKTLNTTEKMMEAFKQALKGFDGKSNRLGERFNDWLARSDAIIMDINTALGNNIRSTSSTLSVVANPVNEFNDNVSITIGSGTDQAGKQTGIKNTK